MRIPPISKGQTIGIVVPARKVDHEKLREGIRVIESWGLKVELGKYCFEKDNAYLAASDAERLSDFQHMLDSPSVDAIFCARGGYGTTRILDQLDFSAFIKHPKWILGFSDITALHLKLHQLGVPSIHGCMPTQFSNADHSVSIEHLKQLLFSDQPIEVSAPSNQHNRKGEASGIIIGGNLSLVIDSLGTSTEPDTVGKILVLEEIDEQLYKIDRMFTQLKRAGKLSQLAGLVIGHMTDLKDTELPFNHSIEDLVLNKVSEYKYPIGFNFPIGHESPNLPWRHSSSAQLEVTSEYSKLMVD
ncbi:MAG: LD-carboxypeptidase [Cyclobacteriaceae bacterium]